MPATHTRETCTRNWYQNLAPETCTKNLSQIYRSFFLQNNRPANHVARFVSRAGQFLCRNAAVCYCVQETCTRKKLVISQHLCKFLAQDDLWLPVSGTSFLSVFRRHKLLNSQPEPTQITVTLDPWLLSWPSHRRFSSSPQSGKVFVVNVQVCRVPCMPGVAGVTGPPPNEVALTPPEGRPM